MDKITPQYVSSVKEYISSIDDEQTVNDCLIFIEMMQRISGRVDDSHTIGFYPRKGKITVYLMDSTIRYAELLAHLGKHTTSRVCFYIKRLNDIQPPILEQIVQQSYAYVKSQDGQMHRAVE